VLCVLDAASSLSRKNPEGTIAAFRMAFGADPGTRLIVKTQRLATLPEAAARLSALAAAPNIELRDATLNDAGMEALYAEADVLLSLHRAEGFGLTIAEAMRRGVPAVATDWSGSADFLTPDVGVPVPARLVRAEDPQRTYHHPGMRWAEPDLEAAAAALRRLRADPALRQRLGTAAADYAATHWNAAAYVARLRQIGAPA
jgi:glycosyltransferase involved in cell wall biosynthesis